MVVLRIEHPVPDYARWKEAFDSDPVDRKGSGVRRDSEFADVGEAEAMLGALRELWGRVDVMRDPKARIVEVAETVEY
jgi:hypothetical protein